MTLKPSEVRGVFFDLYKRPHPGPKVEAKYLFYRGHRVPDPTDPKSGLIVPRNYTVEAADRFAASLKGKSRPEIYYEVAKAFWHGGSQELQRTYDGKEDQLFVHAFTHAASFHLGLVAERLGLDVNDPIVWGGIFNGLNRLGNKFINVGGEWWNNPENVTAIRAGYDFGLRNPASKPKPDGEKRRRRSQSATHSHTKHSTSAQLTPGQDAPGERWNHSASDSRLSTFAVLLQAEIPQFDPREPETDFTTDDDISFDEVLTDDRSSADHEDDDDPTAGADFSSGSGQPAARISDMHRCPLVTATVPHAGGPVTEGSSNVIISGEPAARVGDSLTCVGATDAIVSGSSTVYINSRPAARITDQTAHGGVLVSGASEVLFG